MHYKIEILFQDKPKPAVKTLNFTEGNKLLEKSPTTERPTYAKIFMFCSICKKVLVSLTIISSIPSRKNSNTGMAKDDKYQQEINELKMK